MPMTHSRNDLIGVACIAAAMALVAWLSLASWGNAECRDVLAESQGEKGMGEVEMTNVLACRDRLGVDAPTAE